MEEKEPITFYQALGEEAGIRRLVEAFYPRVQAHPLLGPLFPQDIRPVIDKQYMFLSQFFGGPALYSEQYGHPMMRARHLAFPVTEARAEAWLACMQEAMEEVGMPGAVRLAALDRLRGPAYHFINS
ncbi:globin [Paenibacillus sp. YYML68]|uniref:globin domain-containing protein n=1 Tax=Paenibacillus sp. YYML68 TaxID=2909250 RepID=UPI002492076A|nr:globin [Paenibacillus sp. YYML68]